MFCSKLCIEYVYKTLGCNIHMMLSYLQDDYVDPERYAFEFTKLGITQKECELMIKSNPQATIFDCNVFTGREKNRRNNLLKCLFSLKCLKDFQDKTNYCEYFHGVTSQNGISFTCSNERGDGEIVDGGIGSALCLFGSFFNHACDPNVLRVSLENKITFYVSKPVKKGEQLFLTYWYVTLKYI